MGASPTGKPCRVGLFLKRPAADLLRAVLSPDKTDQAESAARLEAPEDGTSRFHKRSPLGRMRMMKEAGEEPRVFSENRKDAIHFLFPATLQVFFTATEGGSVAVTRRPKPATYKALRAPAVPLQRGAGRPSRESGSRRNRPDFRPAAPVKRGGRRITALPLNIVLSHGAHRGVRHIAFFSATRSGGGSPPLGREPAVSGRCAPSAPGPPPASCPGGRRPPACRKASCPCRAPPAPSPRSP